MNRHACSHTSVENPLIWRVELGINKHWNCCNNHEKMLFRQKLNIFFSSLPSKNDAILYVWYYYNKWVLSPARSLFISYVNCAWVYVFVFKKNIQCRLYSKWERWTIHMNKFVWLIFIASKITRTIFHPVYHLLCNFRFNMHTKLCKSGDRNKKNEHCLSRKSLHKVCH